MDPVHCLRSPKVADMDRVGARAPGQGIDSAQGANEGAEGLRLDAPVRMPMIQILLSSVRSLGPRGEAMGW